MRRYNRANIDLGRDVAAATRNTTTPFDIVAV